MRWSVFTGICLLGGIAIARIAFRPAVPIFVSIYNKGFLMLLLVGVFTIIAATPVTAIVGVIARKPIG